jgi:putative glutamine amidotransferase
MRPLIGIPCYAAKRAGNLRPLYATNRTYVHAIEEAGGVPVLLPLLGRPESMHALRGRLDGLLLSGGGDVDPARYGEQPIPQTAPPEAERDALELDLIASSLRDRLPILGICRGIQVLNVALGGTLYQDIRTQIPAARNHELRGPSGVPGRDRSHSIEIQAGSRLAAILGERHHAVNSFHHQAVNRPGRGVQIVAWAADGIPEALELPDEPFVLAVQFHPERQYTIDEGLRRLFVEFVRACEIRMEEPTRRAAAPVGAI